MLSHACYGIVQVPTGPWFCRKCESQERAARVRCELCPLKDGALKRTDNMGWCHVVCALFIPEAWFANVQTMEPIMLKNVPLDRFNKMCYVCEENGREVSKASAGACMQCNKNGCKMNFHVTCAQAHGLLCEEAGNYGDNVKYCGYCVHHYKKLKRDANIKTIPAFRTIPADNATPDTTPEKSNEPKFRTSGEYKNMETIAGRQLASLSNHIKERTHNATAGSSPKFSVDVKPTVTSPGQIAVSTRPLLNSVSESKKSSTDSRYNTVETGQLFSPLPDSQLPASSLPVTTQVSFPTSLDGIMSSMAAAQSGGGDTETTPAVRARRSRTGSLEKDKKPKRARVPTLAANKGRHIQTADVDDASPPTLRHGSPPTLRRSSPPTTRRGSPPVGRRVRKKTTDSVSSGASVATTSNGNATLGPQNLSVFGGEPHFQSPISLASFTQENSVLPSQPTLSTEAGPSDSLTAPALVNLSPATGPISSIMSSDIKEKFLNGHLQGPPKVFPSTLSPRSTDCSETPQCMEELLERQWEQGSNFLMEQGQHFDIAALLKCLHQLKSENKHLAEYINSLMARRDHLLAVNARLSLPFTPAVTTNSPAVGASDTTVANNSGIQNISDDEMSDDSHINVVDPIDPPILSPPVSTHTSTSHPFLTESLLQFSTSSLQNLPVLSSVLTTSTPDNTPSSQAWDKHKDKT